MSLQQLSTIVQMQDVFASQYQAKNFALFFQYDYAESQQGFVRKYPTAILRGLAVLKGWEWFIDENGLPNVRLCFYNQNTHIPAGPAIFPATSIDQCQRVEPPGVMGYVYVMSHYDLFCLRQEQAMKSRQQIYHTITFQSKSINGTIAKTCQLAAMFFDIYKTRDGVINLQDPYVNLYWRTGIKRMQQTGIMSWYVHRTWLKVKGTGMNFEPFFVAPNKNAVATVDPRASRKQVSASHASASQALASNSARPTQQPQQQMPQQQMPQQQKAQQQKVQQQQASKPKQPELKLTQQQREAILQQIFRHGSIPKEQQLKLTEQQKTLMILKYLQKRQALALGQQEENCRQNQNIQMAEKQQERRREEAILNDIIRKQQRDARRSAEQTCRNDMPPPPLPARRTSQGGQSGISNGSGNGRPSSTQAHHLQNYAQNLSNLKRSASNSMANSYPMPNPASVSPSNGAPDSKRQKMTIPTEVNRLASVANTAPGNTVALAPESALEPKRKYAGRGRPRKNPIVGAVASDENRSGSRGQDMNQIQVVGSGSGTGYGMGTGMGRGSGGMGTTGVTQNINTKTSMRSPTGPAYPGSQMHQNNGSNAHENANGNATMRGSSTVERAQAFPHVEAAAKMVDYFQDKVSVDLAGDGRMQ